MNVDLNSLSLKDLKELQAAVNKAVNGFEDRKRKDALSQLEEAARALGFTLSELTGTVVQRKSLGDKRPIAIVPMFTRFFLMRVKR